MGLKHKKYIGGHDGYCDKIIKAEERIDRADSNIGSIRMTINKLECEGRETADMALVNKTMTEEIKVILQNIYTEMSNMKWWVIGGIASVIGLGIANNIFNLW